MFQFLGNLFFVLYTDANDFKLGAILVHRDLNTKREIFFEVQGRSLRDTQLHYATTKKNPAGRLERWAIYRYQLNITVEHRCGTTKEAPDALSWMFYVDVDSNGCQKAIEQSLKKRVQLNTICDKHFLIGKS